MAEGLDLSQNFLTLSSINQRPTNPIGTHELAPHVVSRMRTSACSVVLQQSISESARNRRGLLGEDILRRRALLEDTRMS